MDDPGPAAAAQPERWYELLTELQEQLPQLAKQFTNQIFSIPGYELDALISGQDLYDTSVQSIGALLESMKSDQPTQSLFEVAEELGRKRARQRMPEASLTMAIQADFNVIWSRLLDLSNSSETVQILALQVTNIWRIVGEFAISTIAFYREESTQIAQDLLNDRQTAIGRLLSFAVPTESSVSWVASELNCDPEDDFTVLVADQPEARDALFNLANTLLHTTFYFHRSPGAVMVFWPEGSPQVDVENAISTLRCAKHSRVAGLARIPQTVTALTALLEAVDTEIQRPVSLQEGTITLARHDLKNQGIDIAEQIESSLEGCSEIERSKLRETVVAYMRSGSVQQTAAELYYHRNTVLKRLNRFADLTGLDITIPLQAASVAIAWAEITDE